jgi:thymidylate kinase
VIELAGGPGAGKTTLLPLVVQALVGEGREPLEQALAGRKLAARTRPGRAVVRWTGGRNRDRALWLIYLAYATTLGIGLVASRPRLFASLAQQLRRPQEAMVSERHVVRWFIRSAGTERLFHRFGSVNEVLVADEGYVHRVVQLFTSAVERADNRAVRKYLAHVPKPDLLVVVDAPVDIAWERVRSRGIWARMSGLDEAAVYAFVRNATEAVWLAGDFAREENWQVMRVDNSSDMEKLAFDLRCAPAPQDGVDD